MKKSSFTNVEEIKKLKELEKSLWQSDTRFEFDYMNRILSPDFFEFGRSGNIYSREEILNTPPFEINALPLKNVRVDYLDSNTALITYVSRVQGKKLQISNRSSIWIKIEHEWKLKFHQGTPVQEDENL